MPTTSDRKVIVTNYLSVQTESIVQGEPGTLEEVDLTTPAQNKYLPDPLLRKTLGSSNEIYVNLDQETQEWTSHEHPRKTFDDYDDHAGVTPGANAGIDDWDSKGHHFNNTLEIPSIILEPNGVALSDVTGDCALVYVKCTGIPLHNPIIEDAGVAIDLGGTGSWIMEVWNGRAVAVTPAAGVGCNDIKVRSMGGYACHIEYLVTKKL